jgi:hypothetical protein
VVQGQQVLKGLLVRHHKVQQVLKVLQEDKELQVHKDLKVLKVVQG